MARRSPFLSMVLGLGFLAACFLWPLGAYAAQTITLSSSRRCKWVRPESSATLTCILQTSAPNATLLWDHNNIMISHDEKDHIYLSGPRNSKLTVRSVGYADAGIYRAYISNIGLNRAVVACAITLEIMQNPTDCPSDSIMPQPTTITNVSLVTRKAEMTVIDKEETCLNDAQHQLSQSARPYNITSHFYSNGQFIMQNTSRLCLEDWGSHSPLSVVTVNTTSCPNFRSCVQLTVVELSITTRASSDITSASPNVTMTVGAPFVYFCNVSGYSPVLTVSDGVQSFNASVVHGCALPGKSLSGSLSNHYNTVLADGSQVYIHRNCTQASIQVHGVMGPHWPSMFTCTVHSEGGSRVADNRLTTFKATYKPSADIKVEQYCSEVHLECIGYGQKSMLWQFEGKEYSTSQSLILKEPANIQGKYSCVVRNEEGSFTASYQFSGTHCQAPRDQDSSSRTALGAVPLALTVTFSFVGFVVIVLLSAVITRRYRRKWCESSDLTDEAGRTESTTLGGVSVRSYQTSFPQRSPRSSINSGSTDYLRDSDNEVDENLGEIKKLEKMMEKSKQPEEPPSAHQGVSPPPTTL